VDDAYLRRRGIPLPSFFIFTPTYRTRPSLSSVVLLWYSFDVRALALGRVSLGRARRGVMAPLGSARQRRKRLAVYALCGVVGLLGYGTAPNAMQSRGPDRVGRPDRVV